MKNLREIEDYAKANKIPILLPESRSILEELILKYQPQNILEIGTAIGFSGCLMLLLSTNSKLTTIEKSDDAIIVAKRNFEKSNLIERVTILQGDATEIIKSLNSQFDFIFLDGPKAQYLYQLPFLLNLLTKNGIILADNVLFRDMVKGDAPLNRRYKKIVINLRKFIQEVESNAELNSKILSIGDGLMIITKK
ncbi:MAG: O-methyltransferase [Clostridia bacterium]|nr:O-methyltransferase [Clostridia bacterium]